MEFQNVLTLNMPLANYRRQQSRFSNWPKRASTSHGCRPEKRQDIPALLTENGFHPFPIPGQEVWLLDEKFMAELLEGIADCRAKASKIPSHAELAFSIARIVGDIAAVSNSAEQRDAALKSSLIQLRRQISE